MVYLPGALTIGKHRGRIVPAGRDFPVSGTGSRKHDWQITTRIVRAGLPSCIHMHDLHASDAKRGHLIWSHFIPSH